MDNKGQNGTGTVGDAIQAKHKDDPNRHKELSRDQMRANDIQELKSFIAHKDVWTSLVELCRSKQDIELLKGRVEKLRVSAIHRVMHNPEEAEFTVALKQATDLYDQLLEQFKHYGR